MHGFDAGDQDSGAAKVLESEHRARDPFNRPVGLLNDIVELVRLAHRDGKAGVGLDADDGGRVGTALVDGDFLRHVVQTDSPFEECTGRSMIALGTQQEIDGGAGLVYRTVQVFPLARDLDISLVHAPALADRSLATTTRGGQYGQHFDGPPVYG